MLSVWFRTLRYAACSLSSLPSCSFWVPSRLSLRKLSCSNAYLRRHTRSRSSIVEPVVVKKPKSQKQLINIYENMTASELAKSMDETEETVLETFVDIFPKSLDSLSFSTVLEKEQILQIVNAFGFKPRLVPRPKKIEKMNEDVGPLPPPPVNELIKRPPVVTIMGHVDHGKTTLLDCLRNSRIVDTEFGGITQHIGAFTLNDGAHSITFLDTPGHAAFAEMRRRGAHSTDIVVLVVAADDGVKEQTVQSIEYAHEAGVPIIVAFNKCDKPSANLDAAKRSLLPHNIVVEELHGDVLSVDISALYGTNIEMLKEAILLKAEEMNLQSTAKGPVEGIVIEATAVPGIGKMCTMIIQRGTLRKRAYLVSGTSWAKVRTMSDEVNKEVVEAGPSKPIRVGGWRGTLPSPGELVSEVPDEERAVSIVTFRRNNKMVEKAVEEQGIIEERRKKERQEYLENRQILLNKGIRFGSTLRKVVHKEKRLQKHIVDEGPSLKLMIFSDVDGTLEAILNVLNTYSSDKVKLQLVVADVGSPSETDVDLAAELGAVIYCFNLNANNAVKAAAATAGVVIEDYNVIYRLVNSLKERLSECLPEKREAQIFGEGRVIKEFLVSDGKKKKRPIAGVSVQWGIVKRESILRYLRNGKVYHEGFAESLQRDDQPIKSAQTGFEVGIAMSNKSVHFKEGDTVVFLEEVPVKQVIDWDPPGF